MGPFIRVIGVWLKIFHKLIGSLCGSMMCILISHTIKYFIIIHEVKKS